jgi:hypothetical protein
MDEKGAPGSPGRPSGLEFRFQAANGGVLTGPPEGGTPHEDRVKMRALEKRAGFVIAFPTLNLKGYSASQ